LTRGKRANSDGRKSGPHGLGREYVYLLNLSLSKVILDVLLRKKTFILGGVRREITLQKTNEHGEKKVGGLLLKTS